MKIRFCFLLAGLAGCGAIDRVELASLVEQQPVVLSVRPGDGEGAYDGNSVEVVFSKPVDVTTLTAKSFVILAVSQEKADPLVLWNGILKEKISGLEGTYEFLDENRRVRFVASVPFSEDGCCAVLVTPQVLSLDRLPLNQTPGSGPNPFFSRFYPGTSSHVAAAETARPASLQLNEIFYDAVGSDAEGKLFVELFGETGGDISGYQILFIDGSDGKIVQSLSIPKGMEINAEGFFVVADAVTSQAGVTKVAQADWVTNFDPPNGPDCIQLLDQQGQLVDVVGYGSPLVLQAENKLLCYETTPAADVPSGSSLERSQATSEGKNNSTDWVTNPNPSPGRQGVSSVDPGP